MTFIQEDFFEPAIEIEEEKDSVKCCGRACIYRHGYNAMLQNQCKLLLLG